MSGTVGTTSCCSYDNLEEIGQICQREKLWFHVDGAYAGSAVICEEYRYIMKGLEVSKRENEHVFDEECRLEILVCRFV